MRSNDTERRLDELDAQLCALLAERDKILSESGSGRAPDRRRLAAVRRIGRRFGSNVAGAYSAVLRSFGEKTEGGRIYDISRELLGAPLYPGDPSPTMEPVVSIANGDDCNVSRLTLGTHTGTHMDAPRHFIEGAGDIVSIAPEALIGECVVTDADIFSEGGDIPECERLLIKTTDVFTVTQAEALIRAGVKLIGVEGTTVGGGDVHRLLLGEGIVIIESLDLGEVVPGEYTLFCAPLKIAGADGAPCRAMLFTKLLIKS